MGYRHYFHKISKTDLEEIKNCQTQIDLCEWSKRHNYNLERHEDDDGEHYDYIVVHEMSHMIYKDHSKEFWEKVSSILFDYDVRKEWLKGNGITLDL